MIGPFKKIFAFNTPAQIIEEELKITEINILSAKSRLEDLEYEIVKQNALIEMFQKRINRMNDFKSRGLK